MMPEHCMGYKHLLCTSELGRSSVVRITKVGNYRTRDGRIASITRMNSDKLRAHGRIPGYYDTTWWYVSDGTHALCPVDDLISIVSNIDEDHPST